ncbi:hypothetical protein ACFWUP_00730 [Nocardia sp. NPDC058658]|uniref:hypothetical protein n=1 Tax=Nocardia sp. NPDC058658 TaxID=3346580 RepID=UPI00365F6D30
MKPADDGSGAAEKGKSNVVRLPKRPRRGRDDIDELRRRPWLADPVQDPAPTRPVTRAELQGQTGSWPADAPPQPAAEADHENVIDLVATRWNRASTDAPARTGRPKVKPRRISSRERNPDDTTPSLPDTSS